MFRCGKILMALALAVALPAAAMAQATTPAASVWEEKGWTSFINV